MGTEMQKIDPWVIHIAQECDGNVENVILSPEDLHSLLDLMIHDVPQPDMIHEVQAFIQVHDIWARKNSPPGAGEGTQRAVGRQ